MISKDRKRDISNVRMSFSYHIKTLNECYIKYEKQCLLWYSNTEKVIYQTREGVFLIISKHWKSVILNTRKSVSYAIQTPKEWYIRTKPIKDRESDISHIRMSVLSDFQTLKSAKSNTIYIIFSYCRVILLWSNAPKHLFVVHPYSQYSGTYLMFYRRLFHTMY